MAVTVRDLSASAENPVTSFTMSLKGWDGIPGGRRLLAGDVVILEVRRPQCAVTGPPGWTAAPNGRVFFKAIAVNEPDPVFWSAEGAVGWEIRGCAVAGETLAPLDDTGTSVAPA